MKCCPECGRELPPKLYVTGRRRQAMLEILMKREGLTDPEIREYVYRDDEDGGAETKSVVSAMCREIRRQIEPQGWTIQTRSGPDAPYFLRKLER